MSITPEGSPPWAKTSTFETYGAHEDKQDYQSQGVTNPLTDISAAQFVRAMADLAAAQLTAAFSTVKLLMNDAAPAAPTILVVDQMTGKQVASYAGDDPPIGFPSGTRNGDGDVTLQWDASYEDEYGVSQAIDIRFVFTSVESAVFGVCNWEIVDSRTVRVRVFDAAGAAIQDPTVCVEVAT